MNIKEALAYLVSLKENKTYEINGDTYSDNDLYRIAPHVDRPAEITVNSLDSIVALVEHELNVIDKMIERPIFIHIASPRTVRVFSTLDNYMGRDYLYKASCDAPEFSGGWRAHEASIIELRSAFVPNEGVEYLLDLLSTISVEDGVTSDDNGVTQKVTTRQGVSLKHYENTKLRIPLKPYRTFTEVEQPESEFILRLDKDFRVGLFEADGGAWKLCAKANIRNCFYTALEQEIEKGRVVVMM